MWPKPKKKGKTKNKLNAIEPEKIPDGPEQIELLRKGSTTGSNSGVHQGRETNSQPREDISGVWKASLMKAIAPGSPSAISTDSIPKMKIPVNRDVLEAQEKQRRQMVFQAVIRIIDRMFDNFQNTSYGFNQVASGSDLELTWMRPQVREENMAAWHEGRTRLAQIFSGRISTRFWTMLVRGTDEGLGVYIMPADKVLSFTPEDKNFLCYLTMAPKFDEERNFTQFLANGLPVAEDLYPSIFRALLDALIRFANEEAAPGEVFDFSEIGIVPEAPPPPKEVKEVAISSSFNADVPRTSYADAVQQIQAHNKAGHIDQLISTSTNARPVDPNEFTRSNSGSFQGLQGSQNPNLNSPPVEEWKGFSSTGSQKQFQTPQLQSQSGNWRTPQGQPVPEPFDTPANTQSESSGSGAWNFIPKTEIQSHQQNSGSQQILQNFQQPQPLPPQMPPKAHEQPQPYRHPLEQPPIPQQPVTHPMADSGIISEFTLPEFQRPSRAELEQLRQDARPPINQSQELAGVSPVFNMPAESAAQIMEQEQFELLSENPPEMSGDFAPITVSHNYESIQSEDAIERADSNQFGDETEIDEFDAISDGLSENVDEFSNEQIEQIEEVEQIEQIEEVEDEQLELVDDEQSEEHAEFDSGEAEDLQELVESESESDSESESEEVFDDDQEIEEVDDSSEVVEDSEESDEIESFESDESGESVETEAESDSEQSEDLEGLEESEESEDIEINEESESVSEQDEQDESDESEESEAEESESEEIEETIDLDESADSDNDSEEESEETSASDAEEDSIAVVEIEEKVEIEEDVEVKEEVELEDESESKSDQTKSESKEIQSGETKEESEKIKSSPTPSSESSTDIGTRSAGKDDTVMPTFTKFPSLSVVEITLGKCPDLSDALSVLLPVLDAQIDELAAQGGKAFTTKDFKRAEAIIKLTEKLEDFKTEASSILKLIDDDEDDDDD